MESAYYTNLIRKVIELSESDFWEEAVEEWDIIDCEEDLSCSSVCVCGKENIKYLYTIMNRYNESVLFPIGSSCINKFGRRDLREVTSLIEDQFRLFHAVEEGRFLSLNTELFSRKLLKWLYEEGAFDTEYNGYDGENDYQFMVRMFNKHDKDRITINQDRKIKAILLNSVRPFLLERLANKIR